jgi:hypothetical protein
VAPILAVVFGVISRKQIAERGQQGAGLALAGLIMGIVGIVISIGVIIFLIAFVATGGSSSSSNF